MNPDYFDPMLARRAFRVQARRIKRDPRDVGAHLSRLHAALEMGGSEPVQGALADLFTQFGAREHALKHSALQLSSGRLAGHVARWFDAQAKGEALPQINALATRWSVLARPSADISTRARRCSVDDSRALAANVIEAMDRGDEVAVQAFLHHCVTCHDNLAFMLARRALLKSGAVLPPEWEAVSGQLEQAG